MANDTIDTNWPARILALRVARGETQAAFAAEVEVDVITVSRWERGKATPGSPRTRRRLDELAADVSSWWS